MRVNLAALAALFEDFDQEGEDDEDEGEAVMNRSNQEGTQADQLRVDEDFIVLRPVKEHEADVKDEWVDC